jgi:hypothetical protein
MYDIKYGGTLVKGDMIVVAQRNYLQIGFYLGKSNSGTIHYYGLEQLNWVYKRWEENKKEQPDFVLKKPTIYYVYITGLRFMKITPDVLTNEEDKIQYKNALIILKELKIKK